MHLRTKLFTLLALGAMISSAPALHATTISTGVFTGDVSENWESFVTGKEANNYAYLPEGTAIFGGAANVYSQKHDIAIFGVTSDDGYGVGHYVIPFDGTKGMGTGSQRDGITINFLQPIMAFGGYFAAYGSLVSLNFSDGSQTSFNYSQQNTGVMAWQGWASDVGITSVSWSGEFVAVDGLQAKFASAASVPETGATLAMLVGAVGMLALARRKLSFV